MPERKLDRQSRSLRWEPVHYMRSNPAFPQSSRCSRKIGGNETMGANKTAARGFYRGLQC